MACHIDPAALGYSEQVEAAVAGIAGGNEAAGRKAVGRELVVEKEGVDCIRIVAAWRVG